MRPNLKREQEVAECITSEGYVSFSDLCNRFDVSPATMRRDLVRLDEIGIIERTHGGAKATGTQEHSLKTLKWRMDKHIDEKVAIAAKAVKQITDGSSIILDASTTCLRLAEAIADSSLSVTVITNYFDAVSVLYENANARVYFIGGNVASGYHSTTGDIAEAGIRPIMADYAFIGTDALDAQRGLVNNRIDIIPYKRLMIANSNRVVCLADHSKFSAVAIMQVAPFDEVDEIITDSAMEDNVRMRFDFLGNKLVFT